MPAFQITRLRAQINALARCFTRPEEFYPMLRDLFEFYGNQAYRTGELNLDSPLVDTYRLPPMVMNQFELELGRLCHENPGAALALANQLWQDEHLETRMLAAFLVGQVPPSPPEPIIERLTAWGKPGTPAIILDALFERGSRRLRHEHPLQWLEAIENWMKSKEPPSVSIGLRAMLSVVMDPDFENLPPVFRMLADHVKEPADSLLSNLAAVLEALAVRSPMETAYFLRRQVLTSTMTSPASLRLVRRCLPLLPPEAQASLRSAL
jgi:hypothetical protein